MIGNQGVGKNKIADQFLTLTKKPCEYVQLHRDTTVHSLISDYKLVNNFLQVTDSALVRALKNGHVLLLDEGKIDFYKIIFLIADKAPTHVTAIIKSLLESE